MAEDQKNDTNFPASEKDAKKFLHDIDSYKKIIQSPEPIDREAESEAWERIYPWLAQLTNNFTRNMGMLARGVDASEKEGLDLPPERRDFLTGKFLSWVDNDRTTDSLMKLRDLSTLVPPHEDSQYAKSIWQHYFDQLAATSAVNPSGAVENVSRMLVKLDKLNLTADQADWRKSLYNTMMTDLDVLEKSDPAEFNRLTKEFLQSKTGDEELVKEVAQKRLRAGFDNDFMHTAGDDVMEKKGFSKMFDRKSGATSQPGNENISPQQNIMKPDLKQGPAFTPPTPP